MTIKALIHVEEKRRDLLYCFYMKYLFERHGIDVTLSNRLVLKRYLKNLNFDIIVIPVCTLLGTLEEQEILNKKSHIYVYPTEGALHDPRDLFHKYTGYRNETSLRYQRAKLARINFLWGNLALRGLQKSDYFPEDQLEVVGAQRIQFIKKYHDIDRKELPVGFLSRFALFNTYKNRTNFEELDVMRNIHGYAFDETRNAEDYVWAEWASARITFEFLDKCKERNIKVKYRPHPREETSNYGYLKDKYGDIFDLSDMDLPYELWLEKVSSVVSFNSTAFYESMLADFPTITLTPLIGERLGDHLKLPVHFVPISDYVYSPKDWNDVFRAIEQIKKGDLSDFSHNNEKCKALIHDLYNSNDKIPAIEKAVLTIMVDFKEFKKQSSFGSELKFLIKKHTMYYYSIVRDSLPFLKSFLLRSSIDASGVNYILLVGKGFRKYKKVIEDNFEKYKNIN